MGRMNGPCLDSSRKPGSDGRAPYTRQMAAAMEHGYKAEDAARIEGFQVLV